LNVLKIELSLHHLICVDLLAMLTRSFLPPGHRPFVQPKRMHDSLDRASIAKQRHDLHDQFFRFAQPDKHRSLARTKRPPTRLAFIALPLLSMADQIVSFHFPSCRAVPIRAK
jgi:hypothetical protein